LCVATLAVANEGPAMLTAWGGARSKTQLEVVREVNVRRPLGRGCKEPAIAIAGVRTRSLAHSQGGAGDDQGRPRAWHHPARSKRTLQHSEAGARPLSRVRCNSMVRANTWSRRSPPPRAAGVAAYIVCSATPGRVWAFPGCCSTTQEGRKRALAGAVYVVAWRFICCHVPFMHVALHTPYVSGT
jgi:hypothetical protein